jgi:hypothetical protein
MEDNDILGLLLERGVGSQQTFVFGIERLNSLKNRYFEQVYK